MHLGLSLGVGARLSPLAGTSDAPAAANPNWLMYYGAWNDDGVWDDNATWEDMFSPAKLFFGETEGAWYDGLDGTSVSQYVDQDVPATAVNDLVARIRDKSGNGHDAVQPTLDRQGLWDAGPDTHASPAAGAVALDPAGVFTIPGTESRFPIPSLPTRRYNVFMGLKLIPGSNHFNDPGGFQGAFATNGGASSMMLLLRSDTDSNFGTWGGGWRPSTVDVSADAPGWSLIAMHEGSFRHNGQAAGTYAATEGQVAGLGGTGSQLSSFLLADLVAIDRALNAFELAVLEAYIAGRLNITLG